MDLFSGQYQGISVVLSWTIWHRPSDFYQDFSGKWKNSTSKAACKSSSFHKYLMLSTNSADSISLHSFVTWIPSIQCNWSKTKENQYSDKQLLSVWGYTLPWILWKVTYWFHFKASCIYCILSIEMCAKQPLEHFFLFFFFFSFPLFFFFVQNQLLVNFTS